MLFDNRSAITRSSSAPRYTASTSNLQNINAREPLICSSIDREIRLVDRSHARNSCRWHTVNSIGGYATVQQRTRTGDLPRPEEVVARLSRGRPASTAEYSATTAHQPNQINIRPTASRRVLPSPPFSALSLLSRFTFLSLRYSPPRLLVLLFPFYVRVVHRGPVPSPPSPVVLPLFGLCICATTHLL